MTKQYFSAARILRHLKDTVHSLYAGQSLGGYHHSSSGLLLLRFTGNTLNVRKHLPVFFSIQPKWCHVYQNQGEEAAPLDACTNTGLLGAAAQEVHYRGAHRGREAAIWFLLSCTS